MALPKVVGKNEGRRRRGRSIISWMIASALPLLKVGVECIAEPSNDLPPSRASCLHALLPSGVAAGVVLLTDPHPYHRPSTEAVPGKAILPEPVLQRNRGRDTRSLQNGTSPQLRQGSERACGRVGAAAPACAAPLLGPARRPSHPTTVPRLGGLRCPPSQAPPTRAHENACVRVVSTRLEAHSLSRRS